jgi:hypothetical protein
MVRFADLSKKTRLGISAYIHTRNPDDHSSDKPPITCNRQRAALPTLRHTESKTS